MMLSRRDFGRLAAGAGAVGTLSQLGLASSVAQTATPYRAMVTIFLFGGNDAWNMVVPTDGRYAGYVAGRTASLALKSEALMPLTGTPFGLHPSFAPLKGVWDEGGMGVLLNTGTLFQPLDRTLYLQKPELRPLNLMSHGDQQAEWQGMRAREPNVEGFLGRIADRSPSTAMLPPLISLAGSNLAVIGDKSAPLVLPTTGSLVRNGYSPTTTTGATGARQAALAALTDVSAYGPITQLSSQGMSTAYAQAVQANSIISAPTSAVDAFFTNPTTGLALTSDIAGQLKRVARMIEARDTLSHPKQAFFVSQGGFDTHVNQVGVDTATGTQAALYADLAMALAGFYNAMLALGLSKNVTAFTMSDFGRVYKANAQRGTDHAWGSNHLIMGGALRPRTVHGRYPDQVLGGAEDASSDGRWIPSIAVEEYVGAIAQWYGVAAADMPYVFPNWSTWNGGGRGPVPLFA